MKNWIITYFEGGMIRAAIYPGYNILDAIHALGVNPDAIESIHCSGVRD